MKVLPAQAKYFRKPFTVWISLIEEHDDVLVKIKEQKAN